MLVLHAVCGDTSDNEHLLKTVSAGDAIDQQEPFAGAHILFTHCAMKFCISTVGKEKKVG